MNILAIETSCDETGIALVRATGGAASGRSGGARGAVPRFEVVENLVASQIKIHRPFGGVVPNLAKREHLKNLPILFARIVAKHKQFKPDLVAVTVGPGLEPALWTGIEFAKVVAKEGKLPLVGANHLEGHLYSFLLPSRSSKSFGAALLPKKIFPAVALIVSGGHTMLLKMDSFSKWEHLGETRDDAAGEAYDKVARLLSLPYPGGPEVEKLAARGNPFAVTFPRPMLDQRNYDFSFSGLKTAVRYYLENAKREKTPSGAPHKVNKADVAAGFEQAVIDVLVAKTRRAAEDHAAESIILTGGVAANRHLRRALERTAGLIHCNFFVPDFKYNMDNAAMIAAAAYMRTLRGGSGAGARGATATRAKKYPLVARGDLSI